MRIRFPAETFSDTGVVSAGPCNPGKWSLQALLSIPWKREAQTPEAPGGVGPGKAPWDSVFLPISPKLSNLNKMRQRNTQQIKEQDKCPPNQTKEEEIGNLPDKEF